MEKPKTSQSATFFRFIRKYFSDYGGWPAVIGSPLWWSAVMMAAISYRGWIDRSWSDTTISVIPNLLGFSLGTYALLFSLISPRIRLSLRTVKNSGGVRYLDEMNATFLHFIFLQLLSLLWALLYKQTLFIDISHYIAKYFPCGIDLFPTLAAVGGFLGTVLSYYSFVLVLAASLTVYRIARINDPDAC